MNFLHDLLRTWGQTPGDNPLKILSAASVVGQGRAAYAAVGVGHPRQGRLRVILIEQRSCGLLSPCGRARRHL